MGLVCCNASVLSAVRMVLLTLVHTKAKFQEPVEGVFVAHCQLVEMYWFVSFVLLHRSLKACVDVDCLDGLMV